jgi:HK97 family phage prohead protease
MASEKFTKSVSFKTTDDEKGNVEAVFSVFNNLDSDGDVVVPGAIKSGFKDDQVPMVFAHKWDQPIGKGKIVQEDDKAVFKGKFFMGTEAGKEAYNLAKEMGDLQEWSFGFRINDYEVAEFKKDGESVGDVRYLKDLEVYEVSPVLVGANRQTYTLAIKTGEESVYESSSDEKAANDEDIFDNEEDAKKRAEELGCSGTHSVDGKEVYMPCSTHSSYEEMISGDEKDLSEDTEVVETEVSEEKSSEDDSSLQGVRFSDEVKDVLAALDSLIVRTKAISVLRSKDGRNLSAKAESALRAVQSDLDDAWQELDVILGSEEDTPEAEIDTEAEVVEAEVPVAEESEAVAEESEVVETEVEPTEDSETVEVEEEEDSEPEEDTADEEEEIVELEEVDSEFEALFAEAQATIAESIIVELEEDE